MCACSPGAREYGTLQSVSSRREDAGRNRRHPDGIGAIKFEAAPRYHLQRYAPICTGLLRRAPPARIPRDGRRALRYWPPPPFDPEQPVTRAGSGH